MNNFNIEAKVIISIIFFALSLFAIERFQLSKNIQEQFVKSKKAKNKLLIDTVSPVVALNVVFGLDESNKEYLDFIFSRNKDIVMIQVYGSEGLEIYNKSRDKKDIFIYNEMNYEQNVLTDTLTSSIVGNIKIYFYDNDFEDLQSKNFMATTYIFILFIIALSILIYYIRKEFKSLRDLSSNVLMYDPEKNNFTTKKLNRVDEVGIIHNAIVSMVEKIKTYTDTLNDLNKSLELKVQERTKELEIANSKLKEQSLTDELTNLPNRRYFTMHIEDLWEIAKREKEVVSIIMCDIDLFKRVNDDLGHLVGDQVLIGISNILKEYFKRDSDFVARYGGEEFIIVLYNFTTDEAINVCKDLQVLIKEFSDSYMNKEFSKDITMSFGVSSTIPKDINYETLVKEADTELYNAKEDGRNCIKFKTK